MNTQLDPKLTHGSCSWIEYHGSNPVEKRDFYQQVLGWECVDMPMADGQEYPGVAIAGQPIGGFAEHLPQIQGWLIYITVDEVDRCVEIAVERGSELIMPPTSLEGIGRMSIVRDPFGAQIAFIKYQ